MIQYPDDKAIINKLKEGDIISFDTIFNKYNKKVYYFTYSYLKNKEEAEDVVQEVFLNLWKHGIKSTIIMFSANIFLK